MKSVIFIMKHYDVCNIHKETLTVQQSQQNFVNI